MATVVLGGCQRFAGGEKAERPGLWLLELRTRLRLHGEGGKVQEAVGIGSGLMHR